MTALVGFFGSEWFVIPGVGFCSFLIAYVNADRIIAFLKEQSLGSREYIIKRLKLMFVEVNERQVTIAMLLMSFGIGFLIFVAVWPNVGPGIVVGSVATVFGWKVPKILIDSRYNARASKFVDQMVDALTLMSNGLKSSLSVPQAMELVVNNMANPIAQEFEHMLSQNRLGSSLEEVLNDLAIRIPYPDVQMFVTAVNILYGTGGDIGTTFDTISKTIRERVKIEKKVAAVTAQGVMQGTIITLIPFVMVVMFLIVDPPYIAPMFNTALGIIMLAMMLVLQIIGGLTIRKIVKIKI